ncbi:metal-dependent hydrolase [Paenibacillus sp. UNC451MF]|uniref:metal-dependent hydrolase n=1 Tax=Paenibacillus sp. UNC451MF TaxID=1449063 RepID=UPI00048E7E79|nr:metal-dependent hydrolase [Paenibacillus sp. UNC451MF]
MLKVEYHGHSCVQLSDGEHSLIIDPFLTDNPSAIVKPKSIRVQHVLLTHAHADHIQNAVEIAKANDATLIAIHELATYMSWQGIKVRDMNIGGRLSLGFAELQMVQAFHSSGIIDHSKQEIIYAGMPAGFIIRWNGHSILHAGDTNLFLDMKLIGERNSIDLAFLPIGDLFTMGPEDAAVAAEWLQAKQVVPVHYNTFELIQQDGASFVDMLKSRGIQGNVMRPGEHITL